MLRGERLKALREAKGYTHQQVADLLNLGIAQIWRYEAGKTDPTGDVLTRMAKVFNVSTDCLLGLTDDPAPVGLSESNLSPKERIVVAALRRGQNYEAIKLIVSDN
jgi:transcriptional regulator with XRE-family HTH domain